MIQHQSFSIQHEISVTLVNLAHLTILKNKKSSFQQIYTQNYEFYLAEVQVLHLTRLDFPRQYHQQANLVQIIAFVPV